MKANNIVQYFRFISRRCRHRCCSLFFFTIFISTNPHLKSANNGASCSVWTSRFLRNSFPHTSNICIRTTIECSIRFRWLSHISRERFKAFRQIPQHIRHRDAISLIHTVFLSHHMCVLCAFCLVTRGVSQLESFEFLPSWLNIKHHRRTCEHRAKLASEYRNPVNPECDRNTYNISRNLYCK